MIRVVKPRNARAKRALEKREPQVHEAAKTALFVRCQTASLNVREAMLDLYALKKPDAIKFFKANNIVQPFNDPSSIEFFAEKNSCSHVLLGTHQKKRPHNLVWTRTFGNEILDILELGILKHQRITSSKIDQVSTEMRPLLVFQGSLFEDHPVFQHVKSVIQDFFSPGNIRQVDANGLQHVVVLTVPDLPPSNLIDTMDVDDQQNKHGNTQTQTDTESLPAFEWRTYRILPQANNEKQKLPNIELAEMGPHFTFKVRRRQAADSNKMKMALKKAKGVLKSEDVLKSKHKNVEMDLLGDERGRIHVGKQNLDKLQSRKFAAFKNKHKVSDE